MKTKLIHENQFLVNFKKSHFEHQYLQCLLSFIIILSLHLDLENFIALILVLFLQNIDDISELRFLKHVLVGSIHCFFEKFLVVCVEVTAGTF